MYAHSLKQVFLQGDSSLLEKSYFSAHPYILSLHQSIIIILIIIVIYFFIWIRPQGSMVKVNKTQRKEKRKITTKVTKIIINNIK